MSTTPEQTTTLQAAPRALTIDHLDALHAIAGLQQTLAERSIFAMDEDSDTDPTLAAFAQGAVGLARLATALHAHRTRPQEPGTAHTSTVCADTVDALRARLVVTLAERETPDPDILLSGATMHGFTWGLHEAVKACALPNEEEVEEDAAQALARLSGLAQALSEAAGTTAAHIYRRIDDRKKALGVFPYDRPSSPVRTTTPPAQTDGTEA